MNDERPSMPSIKLRPHYNWEWDPMNRTWFVRGDAETENTASTVILWFNGEFSAHGQVYPDLALAVLAANAPELLAKYAAPSIAQMLNRRAEELVDDHDPTEAEAAFGNKYDACIALKFVAEWIEFHIGQDKEG